MIEIQVIHPDNSLWTDCCSIYINSFPIDERRESDQLEALQGSPGYTFYAIKKDSMLCGILEKWSFSHFYFIEHIAIIPVMQNKGIGSFVLSNMLKRSDKPVILEAEVPFDEVSEKRIDFYMMAGFTVLNIDYTQPPYYPGKNSVPMLLLADRDLPPKSIIEIVQTLTLIVYKMP